jgi:hypothetical protein
VRPKDENQHGSMRPNLMSSASRRASSEENILAMLERDSARRGTSSRMAWYGAGSALAVVMVAALAWLAYDNTSLHEEHVLTPVAVAAAVPTPVAAPAAPRPVPVQPAHAATIVEAAPEPVTLAAAEPSTAQERPALVLLSADEAATVQKLSSPSATAPAAAAPVRKAAAAKKHEQARPAARERPAARNSSRAPAPVRARKARPADTRTAKLSQAPPQAGDAPADSDVALISAILGHSAGRAAEGGQEGKAANRP